MLFTYLCKKVCFAHPHNWGSMTVRVLHHSRHLVMVSLWNRQFIGGLVNCGSVMMMMVMVVFTQEWTGNEGWVKATVLLWSGKLIQ